MLYMRLQRNQIYRKMPLYILQNIKKLRNINSHDSMSDIKMGVLPVSLQFMQFAMRS